MNGMPGERDGLLPKWISFRSSSVSTATFTKNEVHGLSLFWASPFFLAGLPAFFLAGAAAAFFLAGGHKSISSCAAAHGNRANRPEHYIGYHRTYTERRSSNKWRVSIGRNAPP